MGEHSPVYDILSLIDEKMSFIEKQINYFKKQLEKTADKEIIEKYKALIKFFEDRLKKYENLKNYVMERCEV